MTLSGSVDIPEGKALHVIEGLISQLTGNPESVLGSQWRDKEGKLLEIKDLAISTTTASSASTTATSDAVHFPDVSGFNNVEFSNIGTIVPPVLPTACAGAAHSALKTVKSSSIDASLTYNYEPDLSSLSLSDIKDTSIFNTVCVFIEGDLGLVTLNSNTVRSSYRNLLCLNIIHLH